MKRLYAILLLLVLVAACTDPYDLQTNHPDRVYLCVEAPFTSMPLTQTVRLTESVDYQSNDDVPAVSGATVKVSDGSGEWTLTERAEEPGYYDTPAGFACVSGKTYKLSIDCVLSTGKTGHYEAESELGAPGFDIEKIDYKYLDFSGEKKDSTWTLCIWGKDHPETHYFLISTAVNGVLAPTTSLLERSMIMPDTFFNSSVVKGFPIAYLYQNARQYEKYGPCAKFLETGDIVSIVLYTLSKDYYDFVFALSTASSSISVPGLSSQPANIPTNIKGGDAVGYFAICPVTISSRVVDDPFRTELIEK